MSGREGRLGEWRGEGGQRRGPSTVRFRPHGCARAWLRDTTLTIVAEPVIVGLPMLSSGGGCPMHLTRFG